MLMHMGNFYINRVQQCFSLVFAHIKQNRMHYTPLHYWFTYELIKAMRFLHIYTRIMHNIASDAFPCFKLEKLKIERGYGANS